MEVGLETESSGVRRRRRKKSPGKLTAIRLNVYYCTPCFAYNEFRNWEEKKRGRKKSREGEEVREK